jgi:hypothetical protein
MITICLTLAQSVELPPFAHSSVLICGLLTDLLSVATQAPSTASRRYSLPGDDSEGAEPKVSWMWPKTMGGRRGGLLHWVRQMRVEPGLRYMQSTVLDLSLFVWATNVIFWLYVIPVQVAVWGCRCDAPPSADG